MKLIHTSDIHIDSPMSTRLSAIKARERNREIIETFRKIIDRAHAIGAPAVIIAGDLFDSEKVGIRIVNLVVNIIENAKDITFFYLPGNHEGDRLASLTGLPENLKLFGDDWTYYTIGDVTVAGRAETCTDMFSTLLLREDGKNIVVMHGELCDRSGEGGKIGIAEIKAQPIDYLALGHYHSYSETKISDRAVAVYSGTPEGRGFDECGEKGYVILDTDTFSHKFVPIAERRLHICEVDITDVQREIDIEDKIAHSIADVRNSDFVRIVLTGEHSPTLVRDTEALEKRFAGGYYYLELKDASRLKISPDDYKNDRSLKGEFIRMVLADDSLSDEEKDKIIECGVRALAGEEI